MTNRFVRAFKTIIGQDNSIKSFPTLSSNRDKMSYRDFESGGWITHTSLNQSEFDFKTLEQKTYQDNPTFIQNQKLIKSKIFSKDTFLKSEYSRINHRISNQIESLGWTPKLQKKLFDILYAGCGVVLLVFTKNDVGETKIKAYPFVRNGIEIVQITYDILDEITEIKIRNNQGYYEYLDLDNTDYHIFSNIEIEDRHTYLSNLTLASPFIACEVALLERDLEFAQSGFTSIPFLSPKIDKIFQDNKEIKLSVGGQIYEYQDFLTQGFKYIKKQMQEEIKKSKLPIFPWSVETTNVTTDNRANDTKSIRDYILERIQVACFTNGSVTGRDGTANRAVSEQDRDNLEENTVLIFQQMFEAVVNDWILPILIPHNYKEFKWQFYRETTDESIKLREQAQKTYEILVDDKNVNLLASVGLSLNQSQVKEIFKQAHNIDLDDVLLKDNAQEDSSIKTVDFERLDEVFKKYHESVNMSYSELERWYDNDLSKEASIGRTAINRNLNLLDKKKDEWTSRDISEANKTITFIARMSKAKQGQKVRVDGEDTNYSKRDISLMNWAYNPTKSFFADSIKTQIDLSKIPYIKFDDVEKSQEYQKLKSSIETALQRQYQDYQTDNSIKLNTSNFKGFENYLSPLEMTELLTDYAKATTKEYQKIVNEDYKNQPKLFIDRIKEIVDLHYKGGAVTDYDNQGNLVKSEYKGFVNTQKSNLAKLEFGDEKEFKRLQQQDVKRIEENMLIPFFNEMYDEIATDDGLDWIGTIAKSDQLTRDWHRNNSGTAHKKGGRMKDTTNALFYLERWCRCNQVHCTKQQAINAGFEIIE
ncbi:MAG: hypothetical protein ACRCZ2_05270 [Fusobacteriaceae bacterium]